MQNKKAAKNWCLVADIGGTNARFARKLPGLNSLFDTTSVGVAEHENFSHALTDVLALLGQDSDWKSLPQAACFAVASRVDQDAIAFINSPWHFNRNDIRAMLDSSALELINDFAANGYGVNSLKPGDWQQVGGDAAIAGKPIAILGPGTGLGVSLVVPAGDQFVVVDGEGGHVDFAPVNTEEFRVLEILAKRFGRVSVERLLSGSGLLNIYQALAEITQHKAKLDAPEAVSAAGLAGNDPLAEKTLAMFCAVLGSVAGNLALTAGTLGGVYITGGIVPGMLDYFTQSRFRTRFEDKGRYRNYLQQVPVRVVTRQDLGLTGAACKLTLEGC